MAIAASKDSGGASSSRLANVSWLGGMYVPRKAALEYCTQCIRGHAVNGQECVPAACEHCMYSVLTAAVLLDKRGNK